MIPPMEENVQCSLPEKPTGARRKTFRKKRSGKTQKHRAR
jgi:hypothetical protein